MALAIAGSQYVNSSTTQSYTVSGIPASYTLYASVLPDGWTINTTGPISGGNQTFVLNVGIGSGQIVFSYKLSSVVLLTALNVFCDSCKMGEEIMQSGVIFVPSTAIPAPIFCDDVESTFSLPIFVNPPVPTDVLNNDKSDFYFYGTPNITAITMVLQQLIGGVWTDVETLFDSTFGKFFAFGQSPDFTATPFIDDFGTQYTGIFLEWLKVYTIHGVGNYRMKIIYTDIFSATTTVYSKAQYCLKVWDCYNTDVTVKIEVFNSGLRGTLDDNTIQIDYSTGWFGELRLPGIFYETKPTYNKEFNQYGDGDFNALKPIIHELQPKFLMDIRPVPGWMDWVLENYILLSDTINVTDFNTANRKKFVKFPVINDSGIDTKDENFINPLAWSQISFSYGQNNLRRRNS